MDAFKSPEDDAFFAAIGRLTISWAHIESGLDAAITVVHSVLGGDKIEPELPRMLQRKLKYLRASCNKIPALASYKASFPIFADAVQSASDIRHNLIHGSISVYPAVPGEERVAEMSRLLWGAQQFTSTASQSRQQRFLKHAGAATKLASQSLLFASELVNLHVK